MTYTWLYILLHSLIYSTSNNKGHNITQKMAKLLNNTNFWPWNWSFNLKDCVGELMLDSQTIQKKATIDWQLL